MKISYDFNLSLWMQNVEVEGKDEEECFEKFRNMSITDLIEEGYVKDSDITDLDKEIISEEVTYKIYNIEWEQEAPEDLPTEGEVTVELEEDDDEEDILTDAIRNQLGSKEGWWPILFDYKRLSYLNEAKDRLKNKNLSTDMIYDKMTKQLDSPLEITDGKLVKCWDKKIKEVIIPNSVTTIGRYAFTNCTNLTSITIPDSVTTIGSYAFYDCASLTSITIPDSVSSIGSNAFENCTSLTSITIPDSVTTVGEDVFYNCTSLEEITLPFVGPSENSTGYACVFGYIFGATSFKDNGSYVPNSLKKVTITKTRSIPDVAFEYCTNLTSITIPNSVTSIGDEAFFGCTSLTSITIPNSVTFIPDSAFSNCTSLTSITIPDSVTSIGRYAFDSCTSLTSVKIPNSVTTIDSGAFYKCTSLTSITIPDSVTFIGSCAFSDCTNLTSITIPDSITWIEELAFKNCNNLKEITLPFVGASETEQTSLGYIFGASSYENNNSRYVPNSLKKVTITKTRSIPESAFSGCSSLTSITIPNSVTTIGRYAFDSCTSLTSITIPDSVTSIGEDAFNNCNNLKEITVTPKNEYIANSIKEYNKNIKVNVLEAYQNKRLNKIMWGTKYE